MQITELHIGAQALISDGNYGNERLTVGYTVALAEGEDADAVTEQMLVRAREHLYTQAKQSPREAIRHALETPEEAERRYIFESAERDANYKAQQLKRDEWRREARARYGLPAEPAITETEETPF